MITQAARDGESIDVNGLAATRHLALLAARDLRELRDSGGATGREWLRLTLIAQMFDRTAGVSHPDG
jgi:hypothetical protein